MPKYTYHCLDCDKVYEMTHSMSEIVSICQGCGSDKGLNKIPTSFNLNKSIDHKGQKPGTVVKQSINELKEDLEQQKKDLKGREYGSWFN